MSKPFELAEGQKVWVEGRAHPFKKDWMEAYGRIVNIIWEGDEPDLVCVEFDETKTFELYKAHRFESWNDKNESWSLFRED